MALLKGYQADVLFVPFSMPNARGEPRLEAGAQRTLEGVGSTAMFGWERPWPHVGAPSLAIRPSGAMPT